jgi:hypothetical protein
VKVILIFTALPNYNRRTINSQQLEEDGTESRSWVVSTPASYTVGPGLKTSALRPAILTEAFVWFSLVPSNKCRGRTLNYAMTASFHILSNSAFTYHPFIRRFIIWVTEKTSLNKPQINK